MLAFLHLANIVEPVNSVSLLLKFLASTLALLYLVWRVEEPFRTEEDASVDSRAEAFTYTVGTNQRCSTKSMSSSLRPLISPSCHAPYFANSR
jgi:hypothetical protein